MTAKTATASPPLTIDLEPQTAQPLSLVEPPQAAAAQAIELSDVTPADLLRIAVQRGDADLGRLERLANMVREWKREQAKVAFDEAMAKFTALGLVIPKTKLVEQRKKDGGAGPKYWQTEFDRVCTILKPALGGLGFGVRFDSKFQRAPDGGIAWCTVTCHLTHLKGHTESLTLEGPPDDSGAKNPLQEMQSSATFLMRHSLLTLTGTAQAGADNDGRGARGDDPGDDKQTALADDAKEVLDGNLKANEGTQALNAWWRSLTEAQRNGVGSNRFGTMRKKARLVDNGGVA